MNKSFFQPSTIHPPITHDADPKAYVALGREIRRGDKRFVMSRGELVRFAANPWKWLHSEPVDPTREMSWGSLVDCLAITPKRLTSQYEICPETYPATPKKKDAPVEHKPWNWNATYCGEWRQRVTKAGKEPLYRETLDQARIAAARLMEDQLLARLFECSRKQVQCMVEYRDEDTGLVVQVKTLLDLVPDRESEWALFLADLKTANDADIRAWERTVFAHGYDRQASLYIDAFNAVTGESRSGFLHAVQESDAPYAVARRMMSDDFITIGRDAYRSALKRYCQCLAKGRFPGYDDHDDNAANPIVDGFRLTQPSPWMIR